MGLNIVTPPTEEPVTLEELKLHARIDQDDEDELLLDLGRASADFIGAALGKQLMTATYRLTLAGFPRDGITPIRLPRPPIQSVQAITYDASDGSSQTLHEGTDWTLRGAGDVMGDPPAVVPVKPWPRHVANVHDSVSITYQAGFGGQGSIPPRVKLAIMALSAHWYEHRTPVTVGSTAEEVPLYIARIINSARLWDAP